MILGNARIGDRLLDLRIDDGVITEIGATLDGERVNLGGRWVSPGLWDNHVHFTQWTLTSQRVDVAAAASAQEAAALMAAALITPVSPAQALLVGGGFRDALWPDAPTRDILDGGTGAVPTVLVSSLCRKLRAARLTVKPPRSARTRSSWVLSTLCPSAPCLKPTMATTGQRQPLTRQWRTATVLPMLVPLVRRLSARTTVSALSTLA
mgnify:CR=1 FL=1